VNTKKPPEKPKHSLKKKRKKKRRGTDGVNIDMYFYFLRKQYPYKIRRISRERHEKP
jgi:hypothetical protein